MSGTAAQRGFIYQTIIAMIECLERDDWDQVKLEPDTKNHLDKVDIQLYRSGQVIKAIQVKSSEHKFSQPEVKKWLDAAKADASDANEVTLYLVGDSYTSNCEEYIKSSAEIKTYPFVSLDIQCRLKLQDYIAREGRGSQVDKDDLQIAYNNLFAEVHNNSNSPNPFSREEFRGWLLRVLSFPKCLTEIPSINRNVGLIGREIELREVREMLDKDGCIALISGLGGIGKTAVMRWICTSIKEDGNENNHVAWITCGVNLQEDLLLLKESLGIAEGESNTYAYKRIINKLRNFKGTLYLFMDNMSRISDDEEIKILSSLQPNVHVMITARHKIEDIPCINLDTLEPESALAMFYKYYERDLERRYEASARNIVDAVRCHTLLVELLARAAGRSGGTLKDFNEELKSKGFFDVFNRPIRTKHDEYLTIADSVIKLYEISGLTESQKHVMRLFSIFSPEKEIYWKVAEWAGLDMQAIDELVERAWLDRGGLENGFFIHQIIKDSLARQVGDNLSIEAYGNLLTEVINTKSYMSRELEYTKIRERLVLGKDLVTYLERRIENLQKNQMHLENSKTLCKSVATLIHNVAWVLRVQGEYATALEYYRKSLAIRGLVSDLDDETASVTYNNIAGVYCTQGHYAEALKFYQKALDIRERVLGSEHRLTAGTINSMGTVYSAQGDYENALKYYRKALDVRKIVCGLDHPITAGTYNNIASVFYAQKDYIKALAYFEKALSIRKRVCGFDHPDTATTYGNMAVVYRMQHDYTKALEYNEKALAIRKRVLGMDHPYTAETYNNIAGVYYAQGDYARALKYFEQALSVSEGVLGPNHPNTAMTYNNLGWVYRVQGDYERAIEYYEKALLAFKSELGETHPRTQAVQAALTVVERQQLVQP